MRAGTQLCQTGAIEEMAMSDVWVQPTGGALGADIHGVDLSQPVGDVVLQRIAQAWSDHLVLRFSGQKIGDDMLMAFSARFGELDRVPIAAASLDRTNSGLAKDAEAWVAVISNVVHDGKPVGGLGSYELVWHTDMSYNPLPPRASLLYALEVPADGGNTGFLNMYSAYETLPDDLKRAIEGRTCIHDSSRNSAGELRKGFQRTLDVRQTPGAVHPLVRRHPVTGRKALFLGRRPGAYIHGLSVEESESLLDAVWKHATQERFAWYQKWRVGDLVMWDNRCVMHRRDAFDESLHRLMHRTQIVGEPVLAG
jgi:taurine dioxygenase